MKSLIPFLLLCCTAVHAQTASVPRPQQKSSKPAVATHDKSPGERAFEANCSRCHSAPEQLPPHITGTVLLHMRVRASLSTYDEKALLQYLAP